MPDSNGNLIEGDRVWVHEDPDFRCNCEAVVTEVVFEPCGDVTVYIASDPSIPQGTYEDYRFHASFGDDVWTLRNPKVTLYSPEQKLRGIAKFLKRMETQSA